MEAGIFKRTKNEKGFTFLEMAMIIAIAGFLIVPIYYLMFNLIRLGPTDQRMDVIRYGLGEYYRLWGRLPCPGNLDAAPGDAGYDAELRDATTKACTSGINAGGVYIGSVPVTDLAAAMDCLYKDERDAYIATLPIDSRNALQKDIYRVREIDNANRANSDQKSGILKQNCVTADMLMDEHGGKIIYAVSDKVTRLSTMNPALDYDADLTNDMGAITILNNTTISLSEKPQWFILVSLGEDNKGAYSRDGVQISACTSSPGKDQENCDLADGTFRTMPTAITFDANHFDDKVDYSLDNALTEDSYWYWKGDDSLAARDMTFQPNTRMIIDDGTSATTGDKVVVGSGGNMAVKSDGSTGGDITVQGGGKAVYSPKFCYNGTGC